MRCVCVCVHSERDNLAINTRDAALAETQAVGDSAVASSNLANTTRLKTGVQVISQELQFKTSGIYPASNISAKIKHMIFS